MIKAIFMIIVIISGIILVIIVSSRLAVIKFPPGLGEKEWKIKDKNRFYFLVNNGDFPPRNSPQNPQILRDFWAQPPPAAPMDPPMDSPMEKQEKFSFFGLFRPKIAAAAAVTSRPPLSRFPLLEFLGIFGNISHKSRHFLSK